MRKGITARFAKLTWLTSVLLLTGIPAVGIASKLPANLLISPHASPHHVILVEKSSQRLFIYQFDGDYELVATYNIATGENPGDKKVSGDRKTPEGIYFFTKAVGEQYLTSTYGVRAFPMNYPNLMDIRRGKGGNNIWVHGTNEELEERSTNGCIVLGNGDVAQLDSYIKLWNTPIIVETELKYEDRSTLLHQGQLLLETINGWSQAWSQKNLDRYLSYYASDFRWKNLDLQGWKIRKAWLNQRYRAISVQLRDIRLFRQGEMVLATAEEIYRSDRFASHGFKHLYLVQNSVDWRILAEEWHSAKRPAPPLLQLAAKPPPDRETAQEWRRAWEQGDLPSYLAYYHPRFRTRGMGLRGWSRYKRQLFSRSSERVIQLGDIETEVQGSAAVVNSKQEYRSETHEDSGLKTLRLRWYRGRWTIFRETWKQLPDQG
ncbi:MAG: L,D-transpeptidase family protein [Deltaproteobacteria bacterium]|nr:L,D-transpeptidase family protein [Deltaproteobacteria bacterium]